MAGFSKIYLVGREGGFQGADGINEVALQIWVGDASRQWLEPHYFEAEARPLAEQDRRHLGADDLADLVLQPHPGMVRAHRRAYREPARFTGPSKVLKQLHSCAHARHGG